MKKIFLGIIILLLCMPLGVLAEEKVNVYFFHGDGCPHCAEANSFFEILDGETKAKFNLVKYEVWYDEDNGIMMQKISKMRDDNATGVPYIIIGDMSWVGYAETMDGDMVRQINTVYQQAENERYDVMKEYEKVKDTIILDDGDDDYYDDEDYYYDDNYELSDEDIEKFENVFRGLTKSAVFLFLGIIAAGFLVVVGIVVLIIVLVTRKKK